MSEPRIGIEKVLRDYAEMNPGTPWRSKCEKEAADAIQSLRQRVEMLEEHLRAISQSGIDRATKWAGMNAHDIARAALSPKVQEGE